MSRQRQSASVIRAASEGVQRCSRRASWPMPSAPAIATRTASRSKARRAGGRRVRLHRAVLRYGRRHSAIGYLSPFGFVRRRIGLAGRPQSRPRARLSLLRHPPARQPSSPRVAEIGRRARRSAGFFNKSARIRRLGVRDAAAPRTRRPGIRGTTALLTLEQSGNIIDSA